LANEPEKLSAAILKTIGRMGFSERLHKQQAVTRWKELVGDTVAAETEAVRIDGNVLVVKVFKAAWRQQLVFLKDELLAKLEVELGKDLIKDIWFI